LSSRAGDELARVDVGACERVRRAHAVRPTGAVSAAGLRDGGAQRAELGARSRGTGGGSACARVLRVF